MHLAANSILIVVAAGLAACAPAQEPVPDVDPYRDAREAMVRRDIASGVFDRKPVRDPEVLRAMRTVPRQEFVPPELREHAYIDSPLPIGHDQTISQPYIVATMTESLGVDSDDVVLEVGTGSGYQAAVLAEIVKQVYTIEIVEPLGLRAREDLRRCGYNNVEVRIGDGYQGWPEHAPFDAIVVTAAPDHVPQPLIDQLKPGGRMVIPVGETGKVQKLTRITKLGDGTIREETLDLVRFVPMTGEAEKK
jgi:protein-L-isoaspartate(D-aspartate) O-methyltransferase